MKKCKFCGAEMPDNNSFCSNCGAKTDEIPTYEANVKNDSDKKPLRELNIGMFIWSIVNIILGFCTCVPFVLGVISIIFTLVAKDAVSDEKSMQYIKIAKIVNIVTSVLITLAIAVTVLILVAGLFADIPYYHFFY